MWCPGLGLDLVTSADLARSTAVRGLLESAGGGSSCTMLRDCPGNLTIVGTIGGIPARGHGSFKC